MQQRRRSPASQVPEFPAAHLCDPHVVKSVAVGQKGDERTVVRNGRVELGSRPVRELFEARAFERVRPEVIGLEEAPVQDPESRSDDQCPQRRGKREMSGVGSRARHDRGRGLIRAARARQAPEIDHQVAHRLISLGRVLVQGLLDHQTQAEGNVGADRRQLAVDHLLEDFQVARSLERLVARQHFVQDDAKREDIAAGVEYVPRRLFGGHVGNGADDRPWPGVAIGPGRGQVRVAFGQLRETEVCELGIAACGQQDVVGLDVAVQDPDRMRRGEPVGNAGQEFDHLPPGTLLAPAHSFSVPPSMNSVIKYCRPSCSPTSYTVTMCG